MIFEYIHLWCILLTLVSRASIRHYYKFSGLKQHKFMIKVRNLTVLKSICWQSYSLF